MRIEKGQLIAGVPALAIRKMFRKIRYEIDPEIVAEFLEVGQKEGKRIFDVLAREGYVEKSERGDRLVPSDLALRLITASAAPPIPRRKASELIVDFLIRVAQVNEDPSFMYRVTRVLLFGSYLDPKADKVGDVDLALSLERKDAVDREAEYRQTERDIEEGWSVPGGTAQLFWQPNKVYKHLKGGKRGISMVDLEGHLEMLSRVPSRELWPRMKDGQEIIMGA